MSILARSLLLSAAAAAVLSFAGAASAQDDGRLDRLEKQVRELRSIVFQGRDTGQPVEVKPVGPDPAVVAMGARLDAIDTQLTQITGQIEVLQHDDDQARQAVGSLHDENGELRGQLADLSARVAKLEAASAAAAPPPPPPPAIGAAPQAGAAPGDSGTLNGQAAADAGAAPPPPPPASPAEAYRHARALLDHGDYPGASAAFQAFIARYGSSPEIPTAYYWLGESDSARQDYADAVPAYANALKGWPKAAWAGDATVKLARALAENSQTGQACAALGEFDRRYRASASSAVKARAESTRAHAKCGA